MSSVYHILDKIPPIDASKMQQEYEELAQELVNSGKLRIDTDNNCNFARFTDPSANISRMISAQEISDPKIIPKTKEIFKKLYGHKLNENTFEKKIFAIFKDLKDQLSKLQPVSLEVSLKLARLLVQSAHPIVIKWLLHDEVEVFITYSHNIGDMMDMQSWQQAGSNSGMQSTDGKNVAIFVSCGGDPFKENNQDHLTYGNGWPSVARLQIIAGQELGHFADIKRDETGRQIGRHSANFSGTLAYPHVIKARKEDILSCKKLFQTLLNKGLGELISCDEKLKFYHKNNISGFKIIFLKLSQLINKNKILFFASRNNLIFIKRFKRDKYMGLTLKAMIEDMLFNLSPVADVYKRSNPNAEEAIACIEALARVPQQVMKWGYLTTMVMMKDLYKIYYSEVIPSLIYNYNKITGTQYLRNFSKVRKPFSSRLKDYFKSKKSKDNFVEVREL